MARDDGAGDWTPEAHFQRSSSSQSVLLSSASTSRPAAASLLLPPHRFSCVELGLFRGAYPTLKNFRFLRRCGFARPRTRL
jgi:tyrosine-protein phosphatase OCA6